MTQKTTSSRLRGERAGYIYAFILLAVFTAAEVGLYYLPGLPDTIKVGLWVFLAAAKVALVLLFFMHLKSDRRVFDIPVALGIVLVIPLLLIVALTAPQVVEAQGASSGASSSSSSGGSAAPGAAASASAGPTSIDVTETSFKISLSTDTVPAGKVTFHVANQAEAIPHQLVVIKTDQPADQLPTSNGKVDTNNLNVVGSTENIQTGKNQDLTLELSAGKYVLICNLPSHYQNGMYTSFTVTGEQNQGQQSQGQQGQQAQGNAGEQNQNQQGQAQQNQGQQSQGQQSQGQQSQQGQGNAGQQNQNQQGQGQQGQQSQGQQSQGQQSQGQQSQGQQSQGQQSQGQQSQQGQGNAGQQNQNQQGQGQQGQQRQGQQSQQAQGSQPGANSGQTNGSRPLMIIIPSSTQADQNPPLTITVASGNVTFTYDQHNTNAESIQLTVQLQSSGDQARPPQQGQQTQGQNGQSAQGQQGQQTPPANSQQAPGAQTSGANSVDVTETSYKIALSSDTIAAGKSTFHITNQAQDTPHQFELIKTDSTAGQLPTSNGQVDTTNLNVIADTDTIGPGESQDLVVNLTPGSYVLLCNLPGHYQQGMYTKLTVQGQPSETQQ